MTSYERVKAALEHKQPDRVPFDLGGSVLTGMNWRCYVALRKYLGLPEKPVEIIDRAQQLARIDDDLLEYLKVDVACVDPDPPQNPGLATPVIETDTDYRYTDEWGIGWRMPKVSGKYFDMYSHPLENAEDVADIEKFPWCDPADDNRFKTLKQRADEAVLNKKKAYILGRQYAGIWETALWMCGFEKFFCDMVINKKFAHALMDKITELKMMYWEKALDAVGENVLLVSEADDIATQISPFVSTELYKEMVYPYHKKLFDFIHSKAKSKVHIFYHSCGAIFDMIPILIDEGIDVFNPVQVSAAGMDTKRLKQEYGKYVTFWGGGVDTQYVLPFGTPQQVREETRRRIDDLSEGGGFVFATVHNVQADVPPENFMAMWEELMKS